MPLTPPKSYGSVFEYSHLTAQMPALPAIAPTKPFASYYGNDDPDCGFDEHQYQHFRPAALPRPTYFLESNRDYRNARSEIPHTGPPLNAPVKAPLLPPIQAPAPPADDYTCQVQTKCAPAEPQETEEKVGGVSPRLDYEMDMMVDFVSDMAQGMYDIFASRICLADIDMTRSILSSKTQPPREFRKYVSQVLSSTRLPSSTILLALLYLSKRMTLLSKNGHYGQSTRDVYSMLTTALILGSKFLDDNTFQNRSWSEVSNIALRELNYLEVQWLVDMKWDLHIDQDDPEGFQLWLRHWEKFQVKQEDSSLVNSMMRTSLDGNVQRNHQSGAVPKLPPLKTDLQINRPPVPSYATNFGGPWNTPQELKWQEARAQTEYSPPSAPETGPNTPDAFGLLNSFIQAPQPVHPGFKLPSALPMLPSNAPLLSYPTPYIQPYCHGDQGNYYDSSFYASYYNRHFTAPGYEPQSVAA